MATIRWYLNATTVLEGWLGLTETTQGAATVGVSWIVSTGSTFSSEFSSNADRASTTFVANTVPDGTLDTSLKDAFRTPLLNGTFASGNWTFQFTVVSPTQSGAADGQIVFRLIKANADGSSATEITSAQQSASVCTNVGSTDLGTSANVGTLTFNPGAITLTNQYLFIQVAWKRTGAGGMTTTNIALRTGSSTTVGTSILSADFTPATQSVTGNTIASGSTITAPTVNQNLTVTGVTVTAGSSVTVPTVAYAVALVPIYPTTRFFYTETLLFENVVNDGVVFAGSAVGVIVSQSISGHAGVLTSVSWLLRRHGVFTDALYIEVCQSTFGGTVLARSLSVLSADIPLNPAAHGWINFALPGGVTLVSGTTYWIKLYSRSLSSTYSVSISSLSNVYAGGYLGSDLGAVLDANWDAMFRLYTGTGMAVDLAIRQITGVTRASTVQLNAPTVSGGGAVVPTVWSVTIDHTQVGGADLTNFPVAVALTDADFATIANGGYASSSSGFDIRPYADSALTTPLNFELVEYVASSGRIEMHVNIPSISYTVDTVFYLSIGNVAFTTNGSNDGSMWLSAGYNSVYHLKTTLIRDSCIVGNHATSYGSGVSLTSSAVLGGGTGIALSGADSADGMGEGMPTAGQAITVSAWANANSAQIILSRWDARPIPYQAFEWYFAAGRWICKLANDDMADCFPSAPGAGWHFYAGRSSIGTALSNVQFFIDAVLVSSAGVLLFNTPGSGGHVILGGYVDVDWSPTGMAALAGIDELRVSFLTRSDGWILAEYNNQKAGSTFLTIAPVGGGSADQEVAGSTIAAGSVLTAPPMVAIGPLTVTTAFIESGNGPRVTDVFDLAFIGPALISAGMFPPMMAAVVTLSTIGPVAQLFIPTVVPGPVTVLGATRATTLQLFAPTLTATLSGATIVSGSQLFAPTVTYAVTLGTRATTLQLFAPTLAGTVTTATIPTGSQLFAATVTTGPVTVVGPTIGTGNQRFVLTIATGPVSVVGSTVGGAAVISAPSVAVGAVTITGVTLASASQLFPLALTVIAFGSIGAESIPTTVVVRPPTVALATFFVVGAAIPSTSGIQAPAVAYGLAGVTIAPTLVMSPPSVLPISTVVGSTISTAVHLSAPTLDQVSLVSGATIGPNTLMLPPYMITLTMGGATITSTQISPPSVLAVWFVTGMHVPSPQLQYPPTVFAVPEGLVVGVTILSTLQVYAPTIPIQSGFISSTVTMTGPSVAPEVGTIVVGGLGPTAQVFPPRVARVFPPTTCVVSQIAVHYLVTSATLEVAVKAEATVSVRYLVGDEGVHVCCAEVACESC